jgi:hypothetical protein
MEWVRHVACMIKLRNSCNICKRKPERNRALEKYRPRWKELQIMGYEGVDWIQLGFSDGLL